MRWTPETRLTEELPSYQLPRFPPPALPVTEEDLAPLPEPAQRYLRFVEVLGRPRDWSFRAILNGRFRLSRKAAWQAITAHQYSSAAPDVARLFYMVLPLYGIPVLARDTYAAGKGRMLIRPLDLVTVQDGRGMEFDVGELVTWLNDAVLLAPSMLLGPHVAWAAVDDGAFDLTVTDRGNVATGRVLVDGQGAVTDFRTTDRWWAKPGGKALERMPWSTPVSGWTRMDGRMRPAEGTARWLLPDGELPYASFRFAPGEIIFNVPPPGA